VRGNLSEAGFATRPSKNSRCSNSPAKTFRRRRRAGGQNHAGILRQRREQFRRATFARRLSETFARAETARDGAASRSRRKIPAFSGFIFKIQANMDPKHRDRIAFIRVCSGKFERDMTVQHSRSGKKDSAVQLAQIFGNERETVDEAYPGDVIGLVGHDGFGIGDTLTTDPKILYKEIPRFTPEAFCVPAQSEHRQSTNNSARASTSCCRKASFRRLYLRNSSIKTPLLAAVGPLQFEVVQFRLESEYGAESRLEAAPWNVVRWLPTKHHRKTNSTR
jgi:peptide chain release factor 3